MQRVFDFLSENPVFYFATADRYRPRVRPFSFCMQYNNRLYFGMGKRKDCYKQLLNNPNIEVCTTSANGQKWLRVRGVAQFDNSPEALAAAFLHAPYLNDIYNSSTGDKFGLVYISHGEAIISELNGNVETISFT